jgi:hypothetical protein
MFFHFLVCPVSSSSLYASHDTCAAGADAVPQARAGWTAAQTTATGGGGGAGGDRHRVWRRGAHL